jgi:hypothetical protein
MSLKELLNESLDDYINKIKQEYIQYKLNHFGRRGINSNMTAVNSIQIMTSDPNLINLITMNNGHGQGPSQGNVFIYQSSQRIYKLVPKEFFIECELFKINRDILIKKKEDIEYYCRDMIEKCGDVEMEIERILEHSGKLYNYINTNLQPLNEQLLFTIDKVEQSRRTKILLKNKFLINSGLNIQKGIKKGNLNNMLNIFKNVKSIKEILDLLKILSGNPSKYQVVNDLISKGRELMDKINSYSYSNLNVANAKHVFKLMKHFEEEMIKCSSKSTEKVVQEFSNVLNEAFGNIVSINENQDYLKEDNMMKYVYFYFYYS